MTDATKPRVRTTLSMDEDVPAAAKAIARRQRRSVGEVVSELLRRSLHRPRPPAERNGIPLLELRPGAPPVTLETVNTLRDEWS